MQRRCAAELDAGIAAFWNKFCQLWSLLERRGADVKKRLHLHSGVPQLVLWCNGSCNQTAEQLRRPQATQNEMLRQIAGPGRQPDEEYVDWVIRATSVARTIAQDAGIRFWQANHLKSKWHWAGHVCRMGDEGVAKRSTKWEGSEWRRQAVELFGNSWPRGKCPATTSVSVGRQFGRYAQTVCCWGP